MASFSRKRKLEDGQDDYSGGIESEMSKLGSSSNKKHTIDSDEEEDEEVQRKYDVMKEEDIEGEWEDPRISSSC
jgi:hypothetical protein